MIARAFSPSYSVWERYPLVGGALGFVSAIGRIAKTYTDNETTHERSETENKLSRERAQSLYAAAYAEYLPKWQAWREAVKTYEAELAAYEAWRPKFVAVWQAYRERGVKAAKLFETIHENIEKRGRLELELSSPEHLTALFREAIAAAAKAHPDLGILRLATTEARWKVFNPPQGPLTREELRAVAKDLAIPQGVVVRQHEAQAWMQDRFQKQVAAIVEYNLPELAPLCDDARLEAVRDLLPPLPTIANEGHESRKRPDKPTRPTPPEGVIFFGKYDWEKEYNPPVPPEKVIWS